MRTVNTNLSAGIASQNIASGAVKCWIAVFPLVSLCLFAVQPSASVTAVAAAACALALSGLAHASVKDAGDNGRFAFKQLMMGLVAPAQIALLIWLSVYAGRSVAVTLEGSSVAALFAFAGLLAADFAVSMAALVAAERRDGVCGLSVASLVSAKYAGLLGRIF